MSYIILFCFWSGFLKSVFRSLVITSSEIFSGEFSIILYLCVIKVSISFVDNHEHVTLQNVLDDAC